MRIGWTWHWADLRDKRDPSQFKRPPRCFTCTKSHHEVNSMESNVNKITNRKHQISETPTCRDLLGFTVRLARVGSTQRTRAHQ